MERLPKLSFVRGVVKIEFATSLVPDVTVLHRAGCLSESGYSPVRAEFEVGGEKTEQKLQNISKHLRVPACPNVYRGFAQFFRLQ